MHRDLMLCSEPDAEGSHYGAIPQTDFVTHPYVDSPQFAGNDFSNFIDDLVPLAEISQPISQLLQEQIQVLHQVLPDLEEHDKGGLKFELNLAPQQKGKVNWFYSKEYNKVYIKLNEIFNVDIVYSPRSLEKMYIRAMMVYNSEVSEPVFRCENHSSKDPAKEKNVKHSVLRCENSYVTYLGTKEGKNVSDRLSVRIPLGCVQPNEENVVKQTIALKFVCQNSCVGRRETSIIFYLENAYGEPLAKKITAVKICSCPKRDMKKDETVPAESKKRTRKDECPVGKKIMKLADIKVEVDEENENEEDNVVVTPNGVKMTFNCPDSGFAEYMAECAYNKIAGRMASNPDNDVLPPYFRSFKKQMGKVQALQKK